MEGNTTQAGRTACAGGFSVVMARKVLGRVKSTGLWEVWASLPLGNPSQRATAYRPEQRIAAVVAGLASGLEGIGPGNLLLRTNSALVQMLGGRFPDQGTIHRWLEQTTPAQAAALRSHLHEVVRTHGEFWKTLRSPERLIVDIDAQGLVARGQRFQGAAVGYLGDGLDRGYQRYVASVAQTDEILDEFVRPGNTNLMSQLPAVLEGLNEVFAKEWRDRVICRIDSHGGTAANLRELARCGYHYISRLHSHSAQKRLRREVAGAPGRMFCGTDSTGRSREVECWDVPAWTFQGRDRQPVTTRAVLFREPDRKKPRKDRWWTVVTDLPEQPAEDLWSGYHQRGGTIEELCDQSEAGFHLDILRTSHLAGLNALHALVALCWNLIRWSTEDLQLPPPLTPTADPARWVPARSLDLRHLLERASHCGLLLIQITIQAPLEAECPNCSPESKAWLHWLNEPIQYRFALAG